ncbi:hypothetical protein LSUE1_G008961, partial [Lachnellula suecica]
MPSLIVPEDGLSLGSSHDHASKPGSAVPEVLGLTLSNSVIEDMIKCFQNGKPLQLSLGEHPSVSYGTKTQHLSISDDPFTHELYRSTDSDSDTKKAGNMKEPTITRVQSTLNTAFMGMFNAKKFNPALKPPAAKPKTTSTASDTTNTDAALAALQSSLATETARKAENTTKYIKTGLPLPGKKGAGASKLTNKSKFLSSNRLGGDTTRSMPSSPALSGVGSPSMGPTSVPLSQQQAEQAKAARKPIIHLLALNPSNERSLKDMLPEIENTIFKQALEKVGDLNSTTNKYELRKSFYKELDVWSYNYFSSEDRQRAIDNAVKQYDRMRLGVSEPEWDRLLPKAERGTGKSLSKLQAQIARGDLQQRPPKIKVQKEEGSGRDTSGPEDEVPIAVKKVAKVKAESNPRSGSQPPAPKTKKAPEKETQNKRWMSKNTPKPSPKPTSAPPKKEKTVKTGAKVLSAEFVEDSDEEDDYQQPPKPAPKKLAPPKRSREDDAESSDSSIPLSKKVKKDPVVAAQPHRVSDASQSSRSTNASAQS